MKAGEGQFDRPPSLQLRGVKYSKGRCSVEMQCVAADEKDLIKIIIDWSFML